MEACEVTHYQIEFWDNKEGWKPDSTTFRYGAEARREMDKWREHPGRKVNVRLVHVTVTRKQIDLLEPAI